MHKLNLHIRMFLLLLATLSATCVRGFSQEPEGVVRLAIPATLRQLLAEEDTDGDQKITVDDPAVPGTDRGDKKFRIAGIDSTRYVVSGTYYLANLLQELKLLEDAGIDTSNIPFERIYEHPTYRLSRCIREYYWDGLTRRIDEQGLPNILRDEKTAISDGKKYLYVSSSDSSSTDYYRQLSRRHPEWNLNVVQIPPHTTSTYVRSLDGQHGIVSLALQRGRDDSIRGMPFVVPGGRFNEMYGWDSYFILLGLLQDGRVDLAKSIIDNFVYEIANYGAILNTNRTYYLTRSQPPFLSSMAREVYKHLAKDSLNHAWLRTVVEAAIREYQNEWTNPDHLTSTGLSRYFDNGKGVPPEVEPGHFDAVFARFAARREMNKDNYERAYRLGSIDEPELDQFFVHDRAMRESGHDTSYRLYERCADIATVDLNSLLYKVEWDIAELLEQEFGGIVVLSDGTMQISGEWYLKALVRKGLVNQYLWDPGQTMFLDYDSRKGERVDYVSATTLYTLWSGLATQRQAQLLVEKVLPLLEMPGGIVSCTEQSAGLITVDRTPRQWDYPYGWAPHQMLVWQGLKNFGNDSAAARLAYRWLFMITLNATRYNGTITEKYDVVRGSHEVFAEYGKCGNKILLCYA